MNADCHRPIIPVTPQGHRSTRPVPRQKHRKGYADGYEATTPSLTQNFYYFKLNKRENTEKYDQFLESSSQQHIYYVTRYKGVNEFAISF